MPHEKSRLRRNLSQWANSTDQHARDLRKTYAETGLDMIAEAPDRERVRLRGTLRTVTLRPRGGVPALEAELFDGSAAWEDTITRVAVRRGGAAMPVGDLLPVTLPANARRIEPPTAND